MRADVLCLSFMGFAVLYDLTVYSASILPYIQSLAASEDQASLIYSIDISTSALMQVTFSTFCGFLAKKITMKWVFVLFHIIGTSGILIYAFAGVLGTPWAIVFGRSFFGITAAASFGLNLSYFSTIASTQKERAQLIGNFRAVVILSTIPSSIMGVILALPILEFSIAGYTFNAYTYPPWSSFILQVISIGLNIKFLQNVEMANPIKPTENGESTPKSLYISIGVVLVLAVFLIDGYVVSVAVYSIPIIMLDGYGWTIIQFAPVWLGVAFVGLFSVLFSKWLAKKFGEFFYIVFVPGLGILSVCAVLMCVGSVSNGKLPTGLGESFFLVGTMGTFSAFQILQMSASSVFGQVVPSEFIIKMMPFSAGMFGVGKIIGPLLAEAQVAIAGFPLIFYTVMVSSAALMFTIIVLSKHLRGLDTIEPKTTDGDKKPLV